jgi:hypothetical protein
VVTPQWPGQALVWDELDMVPRREAFKEAHPGAMFERFGDVCIGSVPYTERGEERLIAMKGDSYRVVLDALDEYFADGPDG